MAGTETGDSEEGRFSGTLRHRKQAAIRDVHRSQREAMVIRLDSNTCKPHGEHESHKKKKYAELTTKIREKCNIDSRQHHSQYKAETSQKKCETININSRQCHHTSDQHNIYQRHWQHEKV